MVDPDGDLSGGGNDDLIGVHHRATGCAARGGAAPRLRGYAFANDLTGSQVAYLIIERRLQLDDDGTGTHGRLEIDQWPEPGGWPDAGGGLS